MTSSRRREEAEHKAAHFRENLRLLTSAATVCQTLSLALGTILARSQGDPTAIDKVVAHRVLREANKWEEPES